MRNLNIKILFFLIFFVNLFLAQNKLKIEKNDLKTKVYGYLQEGESFYFITQKGILKIAKDVNAKTDVNLAYEQYYRRVYQDSTILNPNTIIQGTNYNLLFFISDTSFIEGKNFNKFKKAFKLKEIIFFNDSDQLQINSSFLKKLTHKTY